MLIRDPEELQKHTVDKGTIQTCFWFARIQHSNGVARGKGSDLGDPNVWGHKTPKQTANTDSC